MFDKRGRVALIGSTSRKHRADGVRPGEPLADASRRAPNRLGAGLFDRRPGAGAQFFYGVPGQARSCRRGSHRR